MLIELLQMEVYRLSALAVWMKVYACEVDAGGYGVWVKKGDEGGGGMFIVISRWDATRTIGMHFRPLYRHSVCSEPLIGYSIL